MNNQTRTAVLAQIDRLKEKALERLDRLERSGALNGEESAGLLMADITAELASGYPDIQKTKEFKNLRKF